MRVVGEGEGVVEVLHVFCYKSCWRGASTKPKSSAKQELE